MVVGRSTSARSFRRSVVSRRRLRRSFRLKRFGPRRLIDDAATGELVADAVDAHTDLMLSTARQRAKAFSMLAELPGRRVARQSPVARRPPEVEYTSFRASGGNAVRPLRPCVCIPSRPESPLRAASLPSVDAVLRQASRVRIEASAGMPAERDATRVARLEPLDSSTNTPAASSSHALPDIHPVNSPRDGSS